jgi:DNA polymerase III subunit gamma/tau
MARALYRKYRSTSLDEIVGQRHITDILTRALKAGRISHAYLLTGPRGVGKTSVARILAHEINQLPYDESSTHLDIIEIDAASNNGVEDVRDLREKVQLAPVSAAKKVYIIDEVHMLSKPAFNALLKTLEEPPAHVVFILATTDLDKLPATIVSRTQRYGFRAIAEVDAIAHLRHIADTEKIPVDDAALALIAKRGDGSFRDSISLLDQLASLADEKTGITVPLIEETLGLAPAALVSALVTAVKAHDLATIVTTLDEVTSLGINPTTLTGQLSDTLLTLITSEPDLLPLLDALLEVPKSTQPHIKLLTVLAGQANEAKQPKSVALAAPVREVSATIEELSKKAVQKKPAEPTTIASTKVNKPQPSSEAVPRSKAVAFAWDTLVDHVKREYVALYSVLSKCKHELDGDTLTLYAGNAFYKKKLEDAKYAPQLYRALEAIGSVGLSVTVLATALPPKSSQAAAVADIMGGGEEVSLDADLSSAPAAA